MFISSLGPIPSEGPSEEVNFSGEARARWSLGLSKASSGSFTRPERDGIHKSGLRGSWSTQITVSTRILEERPSSGAGGLLVRLGPLTSMEKVRGDISWAGEGASAIFLCVLRIALDSSRRSLKTQEKQPSRHPRISSAPVSAHPACRL